MHNITKIKLFRILLQCSYPFALLFVYPFAILKKKQNSRHFFFLDRYELGGAQRVHIDILNAIIEKPKVLYFTRLSTENTFKKEFYSIPNTAAKDIHFWCDNLLFRLLTVHYYAFYLNRHDNSIVFSSNSTFFYDLLPWIKNNSIQKMELLHNFTYGNNGMEFFGLMNYRYLDKRLLIDTHTLDNIKNQYAEYDVPALFEERLQYIGTGVDIPTLMPVKDFSLPLKVLYAGRGGAQKRVHLLNQIAEFCIDNKLWIEFRFAGNVIDELSQKVKENSLLYGTVSDKQKINEIYRDANVILMTSAYEGFPMLIKEGMAMGCVPVVTALEGNKMHLISGSNSFLINEIQDEEKVVREGIENLNRLINEKGLLEKLSQEAFRYATVHFSKMNFIKAYQELLK